MRTLLSIALALSSATLLSAESELFPKPQQMTTASSQVRVSTPIMRRLSSTLDTLTMPYIGQQRRLFAQARLRLGVKGDASVASVAAKLPTQAEGYYLEVKPQGITLAGVDSVGLYYGLQTLRQLLHQPRLKATTITDWPDVALRGVVEGFYGNPYSHRNRLEQFRFYGDTKLNTYIYGPKDDRYHREKWRELYPERERQRIAELVQAAHARGVQFVWAIHPGLDIKWTEEDRQAVVRKLEDMYRLGVRSFAVFFDDISADVESARHQAELLNYLWRYFPKAGMQVKSLILCPTQYNQAWARGGYLDILGQTMDPEIHIMWTGKTVVTMIDRKTMEYVNARIRRKGYVWLNYPVSDFAVDHLLLGPMKGNEQDLAPLFSGFVSNPMEYAEASKMGVFAVADYLWNMQGYDADRSWREATRYLYPKNTEAFRRFALDNVDPGTNGHRFRIEGESLDLRPIVEQYKAAYSAGSVTDELRQALGQRFDRMEQDAATLLADKHNADMQEELKPWLEVYQYMARQGKVLIDMQRLLAAKDSTGFIERFKQLQALEALQGAIRSRDFKGSINAPFPKPADAVLAPFLAQLKRELYADYRKGFGYQAQLLPQPPLEEGKYLIRVAGGYLSNSMDPKQGLQIVAELDSINPQRQLWLLSYDNAAGRYTMRSAQDQRIVTTDFKLLQQADLTKECFTLHKDAQGHFALQNSLEKLGYMWAVTKEGKLRIHYRREARPEDYIFEFVPQR